MAFKPLPIGIEDFEKLRKNGYYYVDKTLLIKDLLDKGGEVNLFTRPRRFGKTLAMSMLQCFFEKGRLNAKQLFQGLAIFDAGEPYLSHMSAYPVIKISMKSMKQSSFELAYEQMKKLIAEEYGRHDGVLKDESLTEAEKTRFCKIRDVQGTEADYLEFAVITGCLRISKESIFTGLNNLKMISVTNPLYGEHFGFTEEEVQKLLHFYDRDSCRIAVWEETA